MISSFQLKSVSATLAYHADAFKLDHNSEGPAGELTPSAWGGRGAVLAGLIPGQPVSEKDLRAVLSGEIGDQKLTGGFSREHGAGYHKPGTDFTFSPGKSVSITALVGGDERLIAAHNAAVGEAMSFLERNGAQSRDGQATENLLYAQFQHATSRQQDPQLHTHVVIANATRDEHGTWRALDSRELLVERKAADQVYGQSLKRSLERLGYRTEQGRSGPEISGFSKEQLSAFSLRTADIERHLEARGLSIETASAAQKQVANLSTRPDKEALPRAELQQLWQERGREVGLHAGSLSAEREPAQKVQLLEMSPEQLDKVVDRVADEMKAAGAKFDAAHSPRSYLAQRPIVESRAKLSH